jgi:type IV pilus assembly protein PilX
MRPLLQPWSRRLPRRRRPGERGLVLVCALMLMLGALILGVSIARTAFGSMGVARMARERMVARAAAEAALADAEADIKGGALPSSARAAWFAGGGAGGGGAGGSDNGASADDASSGDKSGSNASGSHGNGSGNSSGNGTGNGTGNSGGFADGCGQGSQDLGLCLPAVPPLSPTWQAIDLAGGDNAPVVPYGRYTGATLAVGGGILPARLPAYLVEKLEPVAAGPPSHHLYRITAIGFGPHAATRVVLQAVYRKPAAGGAGPSAAPAAPAASAASAAAAALAAPPAPAESAGPGPPAGRISWREIANWPELHAQAIR